MQVFFRAKPLPGYADRPAAHAVPCDYIGPPDRDSNLRPFVRHQPVGFERTETDAEYELRIRRVQVEEWNQTFWSRHNRRFVEEKERFEQAHRALDDSTPMTADKMSVFYKEFLDKNWRTHFMYNVSWYMKNADLLILSAQVTVQRWLLRRKQEKEAKE